MKVKKAIKLIREFLDQNPNEQYFLDEVIYDVFGLNISDEQFKLIEKEFERTDKFK